MASRAVQCSHSVLSGRKEGESTTAERYRSTQRLARAHETAPKLAPILDCDSGFVNRKCQNRAVQNRGHRRLSSSVWRGFGMESRKEVAESVRTINAQGFADVILFPRRPRSVYASSWPGRRPNRRPEQKIPADTERFGAGAGTWCENP